MPHPGSSHFSLTKPAIGMEPMTTRQSKEKPPLGRDAGGAEVHLARSGKACRSRRTAHPSMSAFG